MKLGKFIVLVLITMYVSVNVLGKLSHTFWMNPMIKTLIQIKYRQPEGKRLAAQEVRELIEGKSYGYARWPYKASVEGTGTHWVLRFDAAPLTWWRRLWCAVAYWDFNPEVPHSYEMESETLTVKCTKADGRIFFLMDEEEKQSSEPAGGAYVAPEAGAPSAHP